VGFGMAGAEQARAVARFADGVVVGSALMERLGESLTAAEDLVRELRAALGDA
jgi:tryptophan synthase alpha chain